MKWKGRIFLLAVIYFMILFAVLILRESDVSMEYLVDVPPSPNEKLIHHDNIVGNNIHRNVENTDGFIKKWRNTHPWVVWRAMVSERAITHVSEALVDIILKEMRTSEIVVADIGYKGTQLKAHLTLRGQQGAVFKPKRYERTKILEGTPYEGYDRHNAEIAAFQLDRILGFYRSPPVVGRILDLKREIIPVCKQALLETFFNEGDNVCFYGVCHFCRRAEPACGQGSLLEGSLSLWIPQEWKISRKAHPWRRTYSKRKAKWEIDDSYCDTVIQNPLYKMGPRLLDIMDTAIFDFLIGNADRHHYEYFSHKGDNGMLLLIDNGKGFGNPDKDERTILAPIYQCCHLRRSTYEKLKSFSTHPESSSSLSFMLSSKFRDDPLYPILTDNHLQAIDRRLMIVLSELEICFQKKGRVNVLIEI